MFKPKRIIVPFALGFVLSFLISIISTKHFGHSLLRAFIWGVIIALLGLLFSFLWDKYLDTGDSFTEEGAPVADKTTGSHVDITLADDNLSDDGKDLHFSVDLNRQHMDHEEEKKSSQKTEASLSSASESSLSSEIQKEEKSFSSQSPAGSGEDSSSTGTSSFQPIKLGQKLDTFPSMEEMSSSKKENHSLKDDEMKEIEDLPDISEMASGGDSLFGSEAGDDSSDYSSLSEDFSDVETTTAASLDYGKDRAEEAKKHDTETMAKAIATLLKKD